jgi:hypothetical protein
MSLSSLPLWAMSPRTARPLVGRLGQVTKGVLSRLAVDTLEQGLKINPNVGRIGQRAGQDAISTSTSDAALGRLKAVIRMVSSGDGRGWPHWCWCSRHGRWQWWNWRHCLLDVEVFLWRVRRQRASSISGSLAFSGF